MIASSNFNEMILLSFSFFSLVPILYFFSLEISQYSASSKIINIYKYTFQRKNRMHEAIFTQNRYTYTVFLLKFPCEHSKKEISRDISKTGGIGIADYPWEIVMVRFRPDQISKFKELYPDKPFTPAIRMILDTFLDGKEPNLLCWRRNSSSLRMRSIRRSW